MFVGAQNRQISGTVANPEGQPIVGATVVVDGTSAGTTTGSNGKFTLTAPADATLTVLFLGYETQSVPVGGKTWLDIEAQREDSQSIDDVIVVAYGTNPRKSAFTGSASVIKTDDIAKRQVSNVTNALSGVTSGVQVTSTNGQPGTDATVRIRGIGSFSASNKPLYVVDGVALRRTDFVDQHRRHRIADRLEGRRRFGHLRRPRSQRRHPHHHQARQEQRSGHHRRRQVGFQLARRASVRRHHRPGPVHGLVGQSMSTYAQLLRGFTPEQAAQYIEKNVYTNSAGGVGYRVFDYPEGGR